MKKKVKAKFEGKGKVFKASTWECPGCEVVYTLEPNLFNHLGGAELCRDCLRENELLTRLGPIKKTTSKS